MRNFVTYTDTHTARHDSGERMRFWNYFRDVGEG
jgi:hypothetical protein